MNYNINVLRSLAIIAIVLHHSMIAFCGWPPNHAIGGDIPIYADVISSILKAFGLGAFSFISGYVLYYQEKKKEPFVTFCKKKTIRILVPCLLFAVVYDIFFPDFMFNDFPSPINGTHLWYLPMLFICLCVISLDIYKPQFSFCLIFLFWIICVGLYRFVPIRTISECFHYLPMILAGYLFNKYRLDERLQCRRKIRPIVISGGVIVSVVTTFYYVPYVDGIIRMIAYSTLAYILLICFNNKKRIIVNYIARSSFSIYLLHQFVINILIVTIPFIQFNYYHALTFLFISAFILPWMIDVSYIKIKNNFSKIWKSSIS